MLVINKVSVIIPIYNVDKFIYRCGQSLLEQSLQEVELIFVDDCTHDNSIEILRNLISEYPDNMKQIKILHHDVNRGLPSARNTGLKHATGEFVFHCDSDDWLEPNALEVLYNKAVNDGADIVWCDYFMSFEKNERYMSQSVGSLDSMFTSIDIIKYLLGGKLKYNVWNKLVKRDLYTINNISFPDGYGMGEDMTMIRLFAFANSVSYLNLALYHYVQLNNNAFTKNTTSKHLNDVLYNVNSLVSFLKNRFQNDLDDYINYFKLITKLPFLISTSDESYDRWNSWYLESNAYIDSNPFFNFRTKLIQKAALYKQYWFLKLYNGLVIRLVYGYLYK